MGALEGYMGVVGLTLAGRVATPPPQESLPRPLAPAAVPAPNDGEVGPATATPTRVRRASSGVAAARRLEEVPDARPARRITKAVEVGALVAAGRCTAVREVPLVGPGRPALAKEPSAPARVALPIGLAAARVGPETA